MCMTLLKEVHDCVVVVVVSYLPILSPPASYSDVIGENPPPYKKAVIPTATHVNIPAPSSTHVTTQSAGYVPPPLHQYDLYEVQASIRTRQLFHWDMQLMAIPESWQLLMII